MKQEGGYMYEDDVEIMYHYYCGHQLYNTSSKYQMREDLWEE